MRPDVFATFDGATKVDWPLSLPSGAPTSAKVLRDALAAVPEGAFALLVVPAVEIDRHGTINDIAVAARMAVAPGERTGIIMFARAAKQRSRAWTWQRCAELRDYPHDGVAYRLRVVVMSEPPPEMRFAADAVIERRGTGWVVVRHRHASVGEAPPGGDA